MATVGIEINERVTRLRELVAGVTPEVCIERGLLITEAYKETENEPPIIRRAKALEKILKEMTVRIDDGELIVGDYKRIKRVSLFSILLNSEFLVLVETFKRKISRARLTMTNNSQAEKLASNLTQQRISLS